MKKNTLILIALFCSFFIHAQKKQTENNTIENQFDAIYKSSSTYQVYKVISKEKYLTLKANVLDTILESAKNIADQKKTIAEEKEKHSNTLKKLSETETTLNKLKEQENTISFFGKNLSKLVYKIVIWSIIIILLLALSFFIFKFYRSNILTKKAEKNLISVEREFDIHRKKALEREQKLRRQLQDEINKQRNS
ncbi:hypothetical protein [Polaribacter tangerinus]|uniref:hypothetical protein n=1 Tax=Polaribacter tangerinus TaxID=1920034 RepID=UPI000B4B4702|nr:hypothetical protein [Polaribacter tangerinus]